MQIKTELWTLPRVCLFFFIGAFVVPPVTFADPFPDADPSALRFQVLPQSVIERCVEDHCEVLELTGHLNWEPGDIGEPWRLRSELRVGPLSKAKLALSSVEPSIGIDPIVRFAEGDGSTDRRSFISFDARELRLDGSFTSGGETLVFRRVYLAPSEGREKAVIDDREQFRGDDLAPESFVFTYDDGPDLFSIDLAEYLADEGIRATFFVQGDEISSGELESLLALGHSVANHTMTHRPLDDLLLVDPGTCDSQCVPCTNSCDTCGQNCAGCDPDCNACDYADRVQCVIDEVLDLQQTLDPLIDDGVFLFRPPGGRWNEDVADAIRSEPDLDHLIGPVLWRINGEDYACNPATMTPADCADQFMEIIDGTGGQPPRRQGIVLFHDGLGNSPGTDRALRIAQELVPSLKAQQTLILPIDAVPALPGGRRFSDPSGWVQGTDFWAGEGWGADIGYYGTIRYGDLNGDGLDDVCGRLDDGVHCALNQGGSLGAKTLWLATNMTDALGWKPARYSTTIQLGDVNGDGRADVCGRGIGGMVCGLANTLGTGFNNVTPWSSGLDFSDADGWASHEGYYGTIRLADINGDGKDDVCGRRSTGVVCSLSTGTGFAPASHWLTSNMTDAKGWLPPYYSTTIQLADVDGDGSADLCGRGFKGIVCGLAEPTHSRFSTLTQWSAGETYPNFSNFDNLQSHVGYYGTLRFGDLDCDGKADVCARLPGATLCARSTGAGFEIYQTWLKTNLTDAQGWLPAHYSTSIGLPDLDGDGGSDLCARGFKGIVCGETKATEKPLCGS